MEDLPKIAEKTRLSLSIEITEYMRHHRFMGSTIIPAVELMQVIARSTASHVAGLNTSVIQEASFIRFITVSDSDTAIEAFTDIEILGDGSVRSLLVTRKRSGSGITRTLEHASLTFPARGADASPSVPFDTIAGLEGIVFEVDREDLYRDLVPFGPSYHNITGPLLLTSSGSLCRVSGGIGASADPLGSPFPLDASFHAASVWGQRYAGITGFPLSIENRMILKKTEAGITYLCRTVPVSTGSGTLVFDLFIYDEKGSLYEMVKGLSMGDVSSGAVLPPRWISAGNDEDRTAPLRKACNDLAVIELKTIDKSAEKALSPDESQRLGQMMDKRAMSYTAARLALKNLSRRISGGDTATPPDLITTITPDRLPRCPLTSGEDTMFCSVSHDSRFAVAVVSKARIGIDVEEISERVLKSQRFYMSDEELLLARTSSMGEVNACMRIWGAKEAVSKATGMSLAETWSKTRLTEIGEDESSIEIDGREGHAFHVTIDTHIFTVVNMDN